MSFPAYPDYKNSGVEWLGDVPAQWEIKAFRRVIQKSLSNGIFKKKEDFGRGVLLINVFDIYRHNFKVDYLSLDRVDCNAAELVSYAVDAGDLFFVRSSLKYEGISVVAVADSCLEAVVYECHLIRARPNSAFFDGRYGSYLFNSTIYRAIMISKAKLTTMTTIDQEAISSTLIPVPALYEQTQIARFLDHETARIDALIEEQQRLIELLKEKRQAVISHAVTKGLDSTVPMKDTGVEWLGEVPAHWEVGGLTRFIGPVVDYRGRTPTKVDDGIFLVTARNIRNGRIDYEASEEYADPESAESLLARGRPEIGDLLFTMEAPLGQVALIDRTDIALAQRIVKFRGEASVMRNQYLMFWFMSTNCQARLETLATGSTALGIKSSKLGMIECLAPTLNEQDAIVSHIQRESEKNDALVYEAENVIGLLQERRSALISAAVTGKIDVRGWQPPASASTPELEQEAV